MEMPSLQLIVIKDVIIFYAKTVTLKGQKKKKILGHSEYLLPQYLQMIYRFIYIKFNQ